MTNKITIELTEAEAERAITAIGMVLQDYVESWDEDTRRMMGGKRFYNSLESAFLKICTTGKGVA